MRAENPLDPGLPPFCDPFDAALASSGCPAIFTVDADGRLRLDAERSRDALLRCESAPRPGLSPCLFRDRATGWVQLVVATSPDLVAAHPRADIRRFESGAQALAALAALPQPPVWRGDWS